ncbi:TetR/AcrR family transcriptional regulator [Actinomadura sp. 7K507]|uniref:TetR/AcrR family transcriptional regulator n=1 Tax=Actinomadura sp. 7K507 TaxID=2530365 RepID=UPI00104D47F0|nr:TetR/AcrR family transcriptional regulator [Actinomadura sp. 7K507]TDC98244.1 TetR family transcriptional regulator [Actinomadura sp. 7K507]
MGQRDDLLAGARACLAEKGYGHVTARDIAAASGAHLASIGYHFGSKDNLMNTAVLEASSEWGDKIEAAVRGAGGDTPAEKLEAALRALFEAVPHERDLLRASAQAYGEAVVSEDVRRPFVEGAERARTELAAMILGRDAASVGAADARGLGSVLHALTIGFVLQSLMSPESMPTAGEVLDAVRTLADDS